MSRTNQDPGSDDTARPSVGLWNTHSDAVTKEVKRKERKEREERERVR